MILKAYDRETVISRQTVADHFAALNYEVYGGLARQDGGTKMYSRLAKWERRSSSSGGGGQSVAMQVRTRDARLRQVCPQSVTAMDINALIDVIIPHSIRNFEAAEDWPAGNGVRQRSD